MVGIPRFWQGRGLVLGAAEIVSIVARPGQRSHCALLFGIALGPETATMGRRAGSRSEGELSDNEGAASDGKIAKLPGPEDRRFGRHVRSLRRARGLTQEVLAARSELSPDTVRRLEHGSFSPSLDTLLKLCGGLSLALSTFFEAFELCGDCDLTRQLSDLLGTRTEHEIKLAIRVLQVLFHDLDEMRAPARATPLDEADDELDTDAAE